MRFLRGILSYFQAREIQMKFTKKIFVLVILAAGCNSAFATDKSQTIAKQCSKNAQSHQDWTDCLIKYIEKSSSPSTRNANLNKMKQCEEKLVKLNWSMLQLDQCYMNVLKVIK